MKLLIVTQVVDRTDPVLGFFHRWIEEFARNVDSLEVICLREGVHDLPSNVRVHSLRKESGQRSSVQYTWSFLVLAWQLRNKYDQVFVHMNPEYFMIAGLLWRVLRKRTALWYMHKTVSLRLRIGVIFADVIFTASPQSMRIATAKKRVVGHGIVPGAPVAAPPYPPLSLLTIGRLSPIKRAHILIEALGLLVAEGIDAHLTIVGGPAGKDGKAYGRDLHALVTKLSLQEHVTFVGSQEPAALPGFFSKAHLFLHASDTGSLDKAVLEPLAVGIPVITVDRELEATDLRAISVVEPTGSSFAEAIKLAQEERLWEDDTVRAEARAHIAENHELSRLIGRILADSGFTRHR